MVSTASQRKAGTDGRGKGPNKYAGQDKNLIVKPLEGTRFYTIAYEGGGQLPAELDGHVFVLPNDAEKVINKYRSRHGKK